MKKVLLVTIFLLTPVSGMCDFTDGSFNTHDMQMIKQQQFRFQEYDDYKDFQQQKDARKNKEKTIEPSTQMNTNNIQLIKDSNGDVIIKQQ
ncbi:MAG: hypothetical protein LBK53_08255 [Heliobacteriaceae bacterium]|jgi:hypothetical protein|nr:hypothetical protein [Heliobacteriaceae bacterium]